MTTPVTVAPADLTFEHIKSWDGPTMKDQMRRSEMREAIYRVIASKSEAEIVATQAAIDANTVPVVTEVPPADALSVEEQAAEQQRQAAADAEAQRQAAQETAENEQLRAAGITVQRDQSGNITKLIQDYQVADENGAPIGRPTHLEARSWPELVAKQREAHTQAARWGHRLKSQKITFKDQRADSSRAADRRGLVGGYEGFEV